MLSYLARITGVGHAPTKSTYSILGFFFMFYLFSNYFQLSYVFTNGSKDLTYFIEKKNSISGNSVKNGEKFSPNEGNIEGTGYSKTGKTQIGNETAGKTQIGNAGKTHIGNETTGKTQIGNAGKTQIGNLTVGKTQMGNVTAAAIRINGINGSDSESRGHNVDITGNIAKSLLQDVNCPALISGDTDALEKGKKFLEQHRGLFRIPDATIANMTQDCASLHMLYPQSPRSQEEAQFPVAYLIVVHKNAIQVEMLLRAIYWPQNLYCIHVDKKAPNELFEAMNNIASCLPNVIVPTERVSVVYEGYSRLEADLICMRKLTSSTSHSWRYVINLTGQEFPLKTNREIVEILKIYNGSNDIEGVPDRTTRRWSSRWKDQWKEGKHRVYRAGNNTLPPHNITAVKGSAFGVFSRKFIDFLFTDSKVADFITWLKFIKTPDELIWSTLNSAKHNPHLHVPGAYSGAPHRKPWLAKYAAWPPRDKCAGKRAHYICIFAAGDLPRLTIRKELFANKFFLYEDYIVLHCLNEWIHNKTYDAKQQTDYSYYKKLPFIIK